jgi:hypothetical protein
MQGQKPTRLIIDTNLWISFLIGKELHYLQELIVDDRIKLIISDQLIEELTNVTSREKLRKYFNPEKVSDLISLLNIISENVKIDQIDTVCRDPKDDFLLALAKESKADFLITGDKDLLELGVYSKTKILTFKNFLEITL